MASLVFTRFLLNCDGCGVIFGDQRGFGSLTEARASAYNAGWRFPNRVTAQGKPAAAASDACPDCIDTWTPIQAGRTINHQRALTLAQVSRLPAGSQ
jgi:hypothetical protein